MRTVLLVWATALAACTDPYLNTDVRLSPNGVSVTPTAGVSVGDIGVSVSGR